MQNSKTKRRTRPEPERTEPKRAFRTSSNGAAKPPNGAAKPPNGAATPPNGPATPPHLPPSMAKLAAPKVVGVTQQTPAVRVLAAGERPPFDPDGT